MAFLLFLFFVDQLVDRAQCWLAVPCGIHFLAWCGPSPVNHMALHRYRSVSSSHPSTCLALTHSGFRTAVFFSTLALVPPLAILSRGKGREETASIGVVGSLLYAVLHRLTIATSYYYYVRTQVFNMHFMFSHPF